jgi:sugar phosphate isomerase/epimerase
MARHPRIAVSSPHMSTLRFEDLLPRVAEHFAAWEVFGEGLQYLGEIEPVVRELLPSYDITLSAHAPISDINIASFNPRSRRLSMDLVTECVEAAGRLGIKQVTMHPGLRMPMARWDDEKLRRLTVEAAQQIARIGEEVGVQVCLENMSKNWVFTFQEPDWFEGAFEPPLRFCFDLAHAHTLGQEVVGRYLQDDFIRMMGNVHVSDNDGSFDSHWVLGKGDVPLHEAVKRLEAGGYKGNYVIESNDFEQGVESIGMMEKVLKSCGA